VSSNLLRLDPGTVIGPYLVERKLAHGGMSVLYVARDSAQNRDVVLKIIPDELATSSARVRLMREARALASVEHPGIVRVYGTGDHEGTPWIAMEYVRGSDLKKVIAERGPVSMARALRWIAQVADALAAAHDAGVIHRDLKPSNIVLASVTLEGRAGSVDEQTKLVDFGIAKRRFETSGDVLTSRREVLGTPAYLSPEQLEHGLADERSDVWAVGCVLFECVVGAPPFGRSGSASTMASILRDEPDIPPNISAATRAIIMACLRKSSFARVGSARELSAMVRDALGIGTDASSSQPPNQTSANSQTGEPQSALERHSERVRAASRPSPAASAATGSPFAPHLAPDTASSEPASRASARPSFKPSTKTPASSGHMRTASAYPGAAIPRDRAASGSRYPSNRPSVDSTRGRIKGTAIRAGLSWFATAYGTDSVAHVVARASPALRAMVREAEPAFGIIASGWYDSHCVGELLELMEAIAEPDSVDDYTNALTTAIARDNVGGIYRSLFRLIATPALLASNMQRVWQTYCNEGILTGSQVRPGELAFTLKGVARHHVKLCTTVGYCIQNILRAVGFTGLVIERTQCLDEGHGFCAYEGVYLP
jgi:serine/threonine protein kinase